MSNTDVKQLLEDRLVTGEEILQVARIHKAIYWPAIAVDVLAVFVGIFIAYQLGVLLFVVASLMGLTAFLRQKFLLFVLTNKRIFARYGLLKVDFVDMRFDTIESFEMEQMLPGALMGYANLVVMGTGNRYIVIPYVANAAIIRKRFSEIVLGDQ